MRQPSPQELAIPHAPIRTFREEQALATEVIHHAISRARILKRLKEHHEGTTPFGIRINHRSSNLIIDIAHRQGTPEFALLGFIKLPALEARAQTVQLRLR